MAEAADRVGLNGQLRIGAGRSRANWWRVGHALAAAAAFAIAVGCSGSEKPAENPENPPPLDDTAPAAVVPDNAQVKQGMDLIQQKKFAEAKEVLSAAYQKNPKDPQAAFFLGVAHQELNELPQAIELFKKALELDPKLVDASINLSALLLDSNDAKGALAVIDAGLKNSPKEKGLLVNRALALQAAGNDDEAVKAFAVAVEVAPDDATLHLEYGRLLGERGRGDEAVEQLRKAGVPEDPAVAGAVANAFGKYKAFADCVGLLDKVLASKPNPDLIVRRGNCRHGAGDDDGARADFEAAAKLDPKFAPAYFYLGMHYKTKGDKKQAEANLTKAAELGAETPLGKAAKKELEELKAGGAGKPPAKAGAKPPAKK